MALSFPFDADVHNLGRSLSLSLSLSLFSTLCLSHLPLHSVLLFMHIVTVYVHQQLPAYFSDDIEPTQLYNIFCFSLLFSVLFRMVVRTLLLLFIAHCTYEMQCTRIIAAIVMVLFLIVTHKLRAICWAFSFVFSFWSFDVSVLFCYFSCIFFHSFFLLLIFTSWHRISVSILPSNSCALHFQSSLAATPCTFSVQCTGIHNDLYYFMLTYYV